MGTMTTKTEKVKNFVKENSDVIIGAGVLLLAGTVLCYTGYKIGYSRGGDKGMDVAFDQIVEASTAEGLSMRNRRLGLYVFTAKRISD